MLAPRLWQVRDQQVAPREQTRHGQFYRRGLADNNLTNLLRESVNLRAER